MIYKDRIYGRVEIKEPALLELLKAPSILRLKKISQLGIPDKYYHRKNFSRYEHSIGVLILLAKLGASKKEQIAGLLHDISHTAFSHVIDWVYGSQQTEDFQDSKHSEVILNSSISKVLKSYGYAPKEIADLKNFELLDQEIPNLCVDRIDYSLRQMSYDKSYKFYKNLTTLNNKIAFSDLDIARDFANLFLDLQINHWAGYEGASRYSLLSDILIEALNRDVISDEDFWKDDTFIIEKLQKSNIGSILKRLDILKNKVFPKGKTYETQKVFKKFRYVDPTILSDKKLTKLSEKDKNFRNQVEELKIKSKKGIEIPKVN